MGSAPAERRVFFTEARRDCIDDLSAVVEGKELRRANATHNHTRAQMDKPALVTVSPPIACETRSPAADSGTDANQHRVRHLQEQERTPDLNPIFPALALSVAADKTKRPATVSTDRDPKSQVWPRSYDPAPSFLPPPKPRTHRQRIRNGLKGEGDRGGVIECSRRECRSEKTIATLWMKGSSEVMRQRNRKRL